MNTDPQTELNRLREEISAKDDALIEVLKDRDHLECEVALLKAAHGIPVHNQQVEEAKLHHVVVSAIHKKLNFDMVRQIFLLVLSNSNHHQEKVIEEIKAGTASAPPKSDT